MNDRRLLLVHAHPDDETIGSGATMARYAAEGAQVTLVTCTLGEEGEVIPPELAHLTAGRDDTLGAHRAGELAAACAALGVTDHRFLGGPGRWRDSGMMGAASNDREDVFWRADPDEAAAELVTIIRRVRPQVLVTYDENGFYGHPDHIQAHRVSWRAFALAADPAFGEGEPWRITRLYHTAMARSTMHRNAEAIRRAGVAFLPQEAVDDLPFGCADEEITTEIDARAHLGRKLDAMRAHATQISVDAPWYALSDDIGQEVLGVEHFILRSGPPGPAAPAAPVAVGGLGEPHEPQADLFAGID